MSPKRRSRREDGLCKLHAPMRPSQFAPPVGRLRRKQPSRLLPKLSQPASHYCPRCIGEYKAGKNDTPTRRSDRADGLCVAHAEAAKLPTRKRRAPIGELTPRKRYRLRCKQPPAQLYRQSYRKCIEADCKLRAQAGMRCKAHHAQSLSGLRGVCAARYTIEEHKDSAVPKHCLNNATAANSPDVSAARATAPHTCATARFQQECANPRCRAQYFPEECSHQSRGPPVFTLCCMRGKFSNLDTVPAHNSTYPLHVAVRYAALLSNRTFQDAIRRYNAAMAFASFYDNGYILGNSCSIFVALPAYAVLKLGIAAFSLATCAVQVAWL